MILILYNSYILRIRISPAEIRRCVTFAAVAHDLLSIFSIFHAISNFSTPPQFSSDVSLLTAFRAGNSTLSIYTKITMTTATGAQLIARSLRDLGVTVIFGIVGIPVVEIAEEAINLGIRFVAFRNEQSCSYAASVYGYMTGRPGVCLVVGGPGVLHAMAGVSLFFPYSKAIN